jgi:hypothetical protein
MKGEGSERLAECWRGGGAWCQGVSEHQKLFFSCFVPNARKLSSAKMSMYQYRTGAGAAVPVTA